ncbi:MAG: LCP family protein [Eubacteriales bacterium]|nr:LCP family protein [Eubacteriales bacterium]
MAKPSRKGRRWLFVLELFVMLLFVGVLFLYGQYKSKAEMMDYHPIDQTRIEVNDSVKQATQVTADGNVAQSEQPVQPDATFETVDMNTQSVEATTGLSGYTTYALFGIDHRVKDAALTSENSDTIIICSINNDTKEIKLVSVYRDTLLNIGSDTYAKANAAYAYGGPEQAISMLNRSLDLNITEYVTIDFNALVESIDALGGLDVDMTYQEIVHMNNYCVETSRETGKEYTPIELPNPKPEDENAVCGTYHLNGVQATSFCRIRYTASLDMGRTERQRRVILMLVDKAKSAGISTIFDIMDRVFPMVSTSLSQQQILQLLPTMIGYNIVNTTGFPSNYKFSSIRGSIIVPSTLETNVIELHKFLYGENGYTPSSEVISYSAKILELVGGEEHLQTEAPVITEEQADNSNFYWSGEDADNNFQQYANEADNTNTTGEDNTGGGGSDYSDDVIIIDDGGDTGGGDAGGGDVDYGGGDTGG